MQYGNIAFMIAARGGHTNIVRELLSSGANIDQLDKVSDKYMYLYNTSKGYNNSMNILDDFWATFF